MKLDEIGGYQLLAPPKVWSPNVWKKKKHVEVAKSHMHHPEESAYPILKEKY